MVITDLKTLIIFLISIPCPKHTSSLEYPISCLFSFGMNDETTLKDSVTAVDASLTESIQRPSVGDGDGNGDGTEHRIRTGDDNNQDQEASNDVPATTSIGDGDGGEGGNEHGGDGDGDGTELRLPCPKLSLPALKIDASFHDNDVTSFRHNFSSVLRQHNNYTLIPASAKVVVFDSELPVKHAFAALIEHGIWSHTHMCIGVTTSLPPPPELLIYNALH